MHPVSYWFENLAQFDSFSAQLLVVVDLLRMPRPRRPLWNISKVSFFVWMNSIFCWNLYLRPALYRRDSFVKSDSVLLGRTLSLYRASDNTVRSRAVRQSMIDFIITRLNHNKLNQVKDKNNVMQVDKRMFVFELFNELKMTYRMQSCVCK